MVFTYGAGGGLPGRDDATRTAGAWPARGGGGLLGARGWVAEGGGWVAEGGGWVAEGEG